MALTAEERRSQIELLAAFSWLPPTKVRHLHGHIERAFSTIDALREEVERLREEGDALARQLEAVDSVMTFGALSDRRHRLSEEAIAKMPRSDDD